MYIDMGLLEVKDQTERGRFFIPTLIADTFRLSLVAGI